MATALTMVLLSKVPSAKDPEAIYQVFGRIVRELREKKEIPQEDLAGLLGLSRSSIANIESGKQRVFLHQLLLFAQAFHVDVETLVPALKTVAGATDDKKHAYLQQVRRRMLIGEEPAGDDDEKNT